MKLSMSMSTISSFYTPSRPGLHPVVRLREAVLHERVISLSHRLNHACQTAWLPISLTSAKILCGQYPIGKAASFCCSEASWRNLRDATVASEYIGANSCDAMIDRQHDSCPSGPPTFTTGSLTFWSIPRPGMACTRQKRCPQRSETPQEHSTTISKEKHRQCCRGLDSSPFR